MYLKGVRAKKRWAKIWNIKKERQRDLDVATCSLASPQTSPEKQAQCGFSASVTALVLTQKINEQWLSLCRCSSTHRQPSHHCIKHSQLGSLLFLLNFWANTFTMCGAMPLHFFFMKATTFWSLTARDPSKQVFNRFSFYSSHSVPCSRATAVHFRWWGGDHAHTHSLHWDGYTATWGRRAGVERIRKV